MSSNKKEILIIRLSAMGDVAISVPVIHTFSQAYPQVGITVLTDKKYQYFFKGLDKVKLISPNFSATHKGFLGLIRLFQQLNKQSFDQIIDLHEVLRSNILDVLFTMSGTPVFKIDKGRKSKNELTRKENKIRGQLPTSYDRYAAVFKKAGYDFKLQSTLKNYLNQEVVIVKNGIGIAPFAFHKEKMWPIEKMRALIHQLLMTTKENIFLFGGGEKEKEILDKISAQDERIICCVNQKMSTQLEQMGKLKVMISMDSGNMHLASLVGTRAITIWTATHTDAGFLGFGQDKKDIVQLEDLDCRPCSVFGNKPCWRGDYACHEIPITSVLNKVLNAIDD